MASNKKRLKRKSALLKKKKKGTIQRSKATQQHSCNNSSSIENDIREEYKAFDERIKGKKSVQSTIRQLTSLKPATLQLPPSGLSEMDAFMQPILAKDTINDIKVPVMVNKANRFAALEDDSDDEKKKIQITLKPATFVFPML